MTHSNGNGSRNLWGAIGLMSAFVVIAMTVSFAYTTSVASKVEQKEDKAIVASNYDLLLFEVRDLRKEVKFLRDEVVSMRAIVSGSKAK